MQIIHFSRTIILSRDFIPIAESRKADLGARLALLQQDDEELPRKPLIVSTWKLYATVRFRG